MEEELNTLKLISEKTKAMTVANIRDSEEKVNIVNELNLNLFCFKSKYFSKSLSFENYDLQMLLYTSIQYDVYQDRVMLLGRFELKYFNGWTPSLTIETQLLIVLTKLKLNLRDTDLAHRYNSLHI